MEIYGERRLFVAPLYYGLCSTVQVFEKELRRLQLDRKCWPDFISNDHSDATCHWLTKPDGKLVALVCIRPKQDTTGIQIASLLVHEAVHIWQEVRSRIGEDKPSSEFEAYSIQCIAQELMCLYADQIKD